MGPSSNTDPTAMTSSLRAVCVLLGLNLTSARAAADATIEVRVAGPESLPEELAAAIHHLGTSRFEITPISARDLTAAVSRDRTSGDRSRAYVRVEGGRAQILLFYGSPRRAYLHELRGRTTRFVAFDAVLVEELSQHLAALGDALRDGVALGVAEREASRELETNGWVEPEVPAPELDAGWEIGFVAGTVLRHGPLVRMAIPVLLDSLFLDAVAFAGYAEPPVREGLALTIWSLGFRLGPAARITDGDFSGSIGAEVGVRFEWARPDITDGDWQAIDPAVQVDPTVGLALRGGWRVAGTVAVTLELAGELPLFAPQYVAREPGRSPTMVFESWPVRPRASLTLGGRL